MRETDERHGFEFSPMTIDDHDDVMELWRRSDGVGLSEADERDGVEKFLQRNPGLSVVARDSGRIVGAALCGHDGRRGYISHVAVDVSCRGRGLGRALFVRCIASLRETGIDKCHIFVFRTNENALGFWRAAGWTERDDLAMFSLPTRRD